MSNIDRKFIKKLNDVITADSTNDVYMRDVVGRKTDTANTTVGNTSSLMRYVKACVNQAATIVTNVGTVLINLAVVDGYHDVPTADAETDTVMRDVIGRKTDALVTDVGTTKSIIAYVKGLIQELDQRKVGMTAFAQNTTGSLTNVVNITDKGVLTGICSNGITDLNQATVGDIIVTIDGVALTTFYCYKLALIGTDYHGVFSLTFNHRFNTSLLVQHNVNKTSTGTLSTVVSYTKDD